MTETLDRIHGLTALICLPDGGSCRTDRDAVELIAIAIEQRADLIVIPVERFPDRFFDLETRIAGEILQKFVTYQMPLVIVARSPVHHGEHGASGIRSRVQPGRADLVRRRPGRARRAARHGGGWMRGPVRPGPIRFADLAGVSQPRADHGSWSWNTWPPGARR
jgi:hypothetical protein